ncbi:MAG: hypothetical protein HLUCCO16_03110 [Phormidium sp. OSCR]|nr:MAG: hypothetical protein HLUCCO16_03110 [Phormidium sp. OSCR]
MSDILQIGSILTVDEQGYLVRRTSLDKIVDPWRSLVDDVAAAYVMAWPNRVMGVYIRGSVAAGQAILNISDVDSLAVVYGDHRECDRRWFKKLNQQILNHYPFCCGVEFSVISGDRLLNFTDHSYDSLRVLIATQSVCVWGQDLVERLPKVRPDMTCIHHSFDLEADLNQLIEDLLDLPPNPSDRLQQQVYVRKLCQWSMKRIVRSGFEIVMERDRCFTRDLYPCYERFSYYYPQQQSSMWQALNWAINPIDSPESIIEFLHQFGGWLVAEIERRYPLISE